MKIEIRVTTNHGNTASADITTVTTDPAREGSKALLRLVRLVEQAEKASSYSITLTATPNKIPTIKVVREMTGLGLKEAKAKVDTLGRALVTGLTADQVKDWSRKLDETGAKYEVRQ
jgi:large subunit ribosomal protein L7/L12